MGRTRGHRLLAAPDTDHGGSAGDHPVPGRPGDGHGRLTDRQAGPARVRRPADLLEFGLASVAVALGLLVAHSFPVGSEELSSNVNAITRHLPRTLVFVFAAVAALGTLALVVAVGLTLARHRRRDAVNAVVSLVVAALVGTGAATAWHVAPGGIARAMLHGTDSSTLVRDAVVVAIVTGADIVRFPRWTRWCVLVVGALLVGGVALEELTAFAAVIAPLGGWACGLLVRWTLGAATLRPSLQSLAAGLREAGIDVSDLHRSGASPRQLTGRLDDGSAIDVSIAGRDSRGTGLARRAWSAVRLRGAATGHQPLGVRSELETEALATLLAHNAGLIVPEVLDLVNFEPDTLVLVRRQATGEPLGAAVPGAAAGDEAAVPGAVAHGEAGDEAADGRALGEAQAAELFRTLRLLHRAGIAHRDLQAENLLVAGDRTGFRSLSQAVVGAGDLVRRLDVAQLLTTVAALGGPALAVAALRAGYEPEDEGSIVAVLQPIALAGWGIGRMRSARGRLADVRHELLGDEERAPEVRLERFRWRTVVGSVAMTVAAFVLVGQLKKVNLVGALRHADLTWVGIALLASAVTYVGSTINLVAFVPKRVSVVRGTLVELSGAFIGLLTPPTVGHIAVNARYLRRQGVDAGATAAAVAVSQVVNFVTTIVLLLVTVLLTGTGGGRLKIVPGPRLLAVLGGLVVIFGLFMAIPAGRELVLSRVWPRIRSALPQLLDVLAQPSRLLVGLGGNLLLTASYVAALIASLHAVGAHPPIMATAAVYMAGNAVGTAAPTPGGLGAVEAVMAAALAAIGVPAHEAVPGVLIFRLATFWAPILPGWVTFIFLQRSGTL